MDRSSEVPGSSRSSYIPALDGMRAVAILAVMLFHAMDKRFPGGFLGVDIFFVLSGYLITSLLLNELDRTGRVNFRNFYIRRALRLFPALILVLTCVSLYSLLRPIPIGARFNAQAVLSALFYVSNWQSALHGTSFLGAINHTWSLAIEEQFYILWPMTLLFLMRKGVSRERIVYVLGAMLFVEIAWRNVLLAAGSGYDRVYFGFDTHCDGLIVGCLVALLATTVAWTRIKRHASTVRVLTSVSVALILVAFVTQTGNTLIVYRATLTLVVLATAMILVGILLDLPTILPDVLSRGPLVPIGKISYGVYLWHLPIFWLSPPYGMRGDLIKFPLTFAVAGLSYVFIEQPCLRLKQRFTSPSAGRPAVDEVIGKATAPASLG